MLVTTATITAIKPKESYRTRGLRLMNDVDPYLPGLTREAAAKLANTTPERIAKLSSNENPLGPSPKVLEAIASMSSLVHEYPSPSADKLRLVIGKYMGVDADQVVVSAGSSTLMHAIVDAFTTTGGEIISLDPGFTVYPEIAIIHGRKKMMIPLREKDFLLDIETLERAITPNTQLIFLTRPNNPTSTLIPLEVFAQAAEMAAKVGALIVSDEAYIEFASMPNQSAAELLRRTPEKYDNVMVTRTCSKAFGIANMRIGYGIASKDVAGCLALANAKWPTGALAQAAAVAAIEDKEHLARTLKVVSEGRAWLVEQFNALGLPVIPNPQGNYIMVDVSPTGLSAEDFSEKVFYNGHVLIRGDFSPRYVRISIGTTEENKRLIKTCEALRRQ
jgi:histidinol-phosphate aminotransferase